MVQLTWPMIALGWVINIFQRGTASMGRINEILVEKPEIADRRVEAESYAAEERHACTDSREKSSSAPELRL